MTLLPFKCTPYIISQEDENFFAVRTLGMNIKKKLGLKIPWAKAILIPKIPQNQKSQHQKSDQINKQDAACYACGST